MKILLEKAWADKVFAFSSYGIYYKVNVFQKKTIGYLLKDSVSH